MSNNNNNDNFIYIERFKTEFIKCFDRESRAGYSEPIKTKFRKR